MFETINWIIFEIISLFRDPRLGDESRNHILYVLQNFQLPKDLELKLMREQSENMHAKINEKLIGTFHGREQERKIKIDDTTGNISISNKSVLMKNTKYLEIPITIYTPTNVNKDKMVIYFHGGGKNISFLSVLMNVV